MRTIIKLDELKSIEQVSQFVDGTQKVIFQIKGNKTEKYQWVTKELVRFKYSRLCKKDKGVIILYLRKVTGYSRSQTNRLIRQYITHGKITYKHVAISGFTSTYTKEDVRVLAKLDARHNIPCGQTVKKLLNRAFTVFNEKEYERLSNISVSHIYNLRNKSTYNLLNKYFEKTSSRP
ncbi:MAG: hypothetical protein L3J83_03015 [Proteobacteria bacterium]|nr:hypothetical protein [Pseudomonadota bacterium]